MDMKWIRQEMPTNLLSEKKIQISFLYYRLSGND